MKAPALPPDEGRRLEVLRQYGLLDTPAEQALDDLASLASQICEAPIALVSLVDAHRQWFKANLGLTMSETPRDISFCGHAILQQDLFIIPDASADARFRDNPLVTGEQQVRFYAGAPLVTRSGQALGALCVMDRSPRQLTAAQRESLRMLARQVMSQLELRRQSKDLLESETRLHVVTENARVGLFMVDRDRRYVYANQAYSELVNCPPERIIGKRLPDVLPDVYEQVIRPRMDRAFAGERVTFETFRQWRDGHRYYSAIYEPRRGEDGVELVVGVVTDITDRKHMEEALQRSEAELQLALQAARLGRWNWNMVTGEIHWSPECLALYGLAPDDKVDYGRFLSILHPDDRARVDAALKKTVEERGEYNEEKRVIWPDGSLHWTASRGKVYCDPTGKPVRLTGVTFDITDRKRGEIAMEEAALFAQATIDALSAHVCVIDGTGRVIATNKAWRKFADSNLPLLNPGPDATNYLQVCDSAQGTEAAEAAAFAAGIRAVIRGEQGEFTMEYACHSPGEQRWFVGHVTRFPGGGPVHVVIAHENITKRKQAEERTLWLSSFPEKNPNPVLELDLATGVFHYLNPATLRHFPDLMETGPEHPLTAGLSAMEDSFSRTETLHREIICGSRCYSQSITYLPDVRHVRVYSSEITKRKAAENALRTQQAHAQSLLQLSRALERVGSHEEILRAARETIENVLGFKRMWLYQLTEDGKHLKLTAEDPPPAASRPADTQLLVIAGDAMLEEMTSRRDIVLVEDARTDPRTNKEIVRRLGSRTIVNVPVVLAGKVLAVIGTGTFGDEGVRTLSEADQEYLAALASHIAAVFDRVSSSMARVTAEAELRASELRLRTVTNTAQVGLVIVDSGHRYRYANPSYVRILDLPLTEIVGRHISEILPSVYPEQIRPRLELAFRGESISYELMMAPKAGHNYPRYYSVTYEPSPSPAEPLVVVVIVDITELKQAEIALRNSEERFRQLAENINEVFWITDPSKNNIIYVSPAYEKIWGRTCASLYESPRTWLEAIHPDDRSRVAEAAATKQERGEYDETYRILRSDGSVRWVHDRAYPVYGSGGSATRVVGVAKDITHQRQLEEQFRQSQKMEAIGQLAGGVAHDFNNILAAIMMQVELLNLDEHLGAEIQDGLKEISSAAERAANLTRQLLLFSRKQVMHSRNLDLNEVVTNISKMLSRIIGEDVRLQLNLFPGNLAVYADPGMLDQVLMNLVVNSRDAMPAGGSISITVQEKTLTAETAGDIPDARAGNYACLRVSDTGSGISPENLTRIFEPFFTTKAAGKGTGLGLATVFGIVKQHGGAVIVDSVLDQGTTFEILLPRTNAADLAADKAPKPKPRGGTETILLVEDDESLRDLSRKVLERAGYTVLEASDGVMAGQVWAKNHDAIKLLLTDIVMPEGVSGRELAFRLQSQRPDLKVVFTSGYSAELAGRELSLQEGQNFIQKPAAPNKLLEVVRRSLDS